VRRRWEERKDRSGAEWETGSAASDEMLAGAVGCGDEEEEDAAPASVGVEAEPTSGVTAGAGGAAAPGKNGKNGAGGGGGSAGVLSSGNSGSCSALLLR
jgi:hypothetical protein